MNLIASGTFEGEEGGNESRREKDRKKHGRRCCCSYCRYDLQLVGSSEGWCF